MKYRCLTANNEATQKLFLRLPSMLYGEDCPQDIKTEKQLLTNQHVLSSDIKVFPFIVVDDKNTPVCRCMMTYYDNDPNAYIGFFESQDDIEAVKKMLFYAERKAKKDGKISFVGPIDASIFINYRFKTNHFDTAFVTEPHNKEYYKILWEEAGFVVCEKYVAHKMRLVAEDDFDAQLEVTYKKYLDNGYKFETPDDDDFEDCLEDIYELFMMRYAEELGYQHMTEDQFVKLYEPLEDIVDYKMVRLAYKDDKLKGFCIALPNCGLLTRGRMNPIKFFKTLKIVNKPTEYVMFCDGAANDSPDLNKVLIHLTMNSLKEKGCSSIERIMNENDVSSECYALLRRDEHKYVLMTRWIKHED
jgi:hypothetical protein